MPNYKQKIIQPTPYEATQLRRWGLLPGHEDAREPIEDRTGRVEFGGFAWHCDSRALIPRVESEKLVEIAFAQIMAQFQQKTHLHVVEIGCGSGVLGLSLLYKLIQTKFASQFTLNLTLADISDSALALTQKNLELLRNSCIIPAQITISIVSSNLLARIKTPIDLIIANLPYIPHARITRLPRSVRGYEPTLALDGGADGLDLINKLLKQSERILKNGDIICLECDGLNQLRAIKHQHPSWQVEFSQDCFQRCRFATIRYGKE